jgi:hypothetical protein
MPRKTIKKKLRKGYAFRFILLIANIIGLATIIFVDDKKKSID